MGAQRPRIQIDTLALKICREKTFFFFFSFLISSRCYPADHKVGRSSKEKGEPSAPGQTCYCSAKLLHWQDLNFSLGAGLYWGLILGQCHSQSSRTRAVAQAYHPADKHHGLRCVRTAWEHARFHWELHWISILHPVYVKTLASLFYWEAGRTVQLGFL